MTEIAERNRKMLEAKLASVFDEQVIGLTADLREILLDDMVTAFENRLKVLKRAVNKTPN